MSWYKHDQSPPKSNKRQETYTPVQSSFFTDPQSHNEQSRSLKARNQLNKDFKNEYILQSQIAADKREERYQSKRYNAERKAEQVAAETSFAQEKENEKQSKLDKQRQYQNELVLQLQDKQSRQQMQKNKDDSVTYGSFFKAEAPKHTRDITNTEERDALKAHLKSQREKQDKYAQELAFQLEEKNVQKNQKKQESEAQASTGLDIRGSYKFQGLSQKEFRNELAMQIDQKQYLKQRAKERDVYEKPEQAEYELYTKSTGNQSSPNIYSQGAGKSTRAKENNATDIFGNPVRPQTKQGNQQTNVDIFGNPVLYPSSRK
eukprot:CAMPEP_0176412892 /NCGR_PEP_ID=MMETSP0127-20121128/4391_1 /TAXON_ID=938130 /ORGANISM="Platyophrya macrostoma, Strain WH" /LENGTH=317 /DNA_ID=CAMNT_0017792603 /DNA_START=33 /DNA_END=986 /DNA_ORIENTATION=+